MLKVCYSFCKLRVQTTFPIRLVSMKIIFKSDIENEMSHDRPSRIR